MSNHSRRAVLAGIAAAPALVAPALALTGAGPDPIFAAIKRHKASYAAFGHFLELKDKFEDEHGREHASPEHEEWQRREDEACDAESSATTEMVATVPTTIAGVVALLRYVDEAHAGGNKLLYDETFEDLISTTVSALDRIGAVS
jgi:hypothetical protein